MNVSCLLSNYLFDDEPYKPGESEEDILRHDGVVDVRAGVHQLLSQPLVATIWRSKESKVHLKIPEDGVEGRDDLAGEPDIGQGSRLEIMLQETKRVKIL